MGENVYMLWDLNQKVHRLAFMLVCFLLCFATASHSAEGTNPAEPTAFLLNLSTKTPGAPQYLALAGVGPQVDVGQIAAMPLSAFQPFSTVKRYDTDNQHVVWLRFRVQQTELVSAEEPVTSQNWTLELPDTMLNRADFYYQDGAGKWLVQSAGQRVAMGKWSRPGLFPSFDLPVLQPGVHDFYLRVQQGLPVYLAPRLLPTQSARAAMQTSFLIAGAVLGFIALMVALSCVLAITHRTMTYAWYALYATFAFLAAASYMGIGSMYFWPTLDEWPKLSAPFFLLCAVIVQLQFSKMLFLQTHEKPLLSLLTYANIFALLVAAICFIVSKDAQLRALLIVGSLALCVCNTFCIVTSVWRQQKLIVCLWHIAYLPLLLCAITVGLHRLGWFNTPGLPVDSTLYALVFEMVVLLVALNLHARNAVSVRVHQKILATIDPLSGFLAAPAFKVKLRQTWEQMIANNADIAVAYVQVVPMVKAGWLEASSSQTDQQQRVVRMLHTVARPHDIIGNLDPTTFAIAMPGLGIGNDLEARLSRLVALAMMGNAETPRAQAISLRIAASTQRSYGGALDALDMSLRVKLSDERIWTNLPIHFVKKKMPATEHPALTLTSLWHRNSDESIGLSVPDTR